MKLQNVFDKLSKFSDLTREEGEGLVFLAKLGAAILTAREMGPNPNPFHEICDDCADSPTQIENALNLL